MKWKGNYNENIKDIELFINVLNQNCEDQIPEDIILEYEDDGKGFNNIDNYNGIGIKNIKSRANEIGAKLNYESSLGNGTFVELVVKFT